VKSYIRNTINLSCAKILLTSVIGLLFFFFFFFFFCATAPTWAQVASLLRFLDHTQLDTRTPGRTILWMTDQLVAEAATYIAHSKHKRRTTMPIAGLDPVIPAIKRLEAYDLDRTITGTD